MNFEDFFNEAERLKIRMNSDGHAQRKIVLLSNEALFHLPLLAIVILVLSVGHAKPSVSSLGQLVGECLEKALTGFKGTSQHIGWSANLRVRTVKALTFLETSDLVQVDTRTKEISATEKGRKVAKAAIADESNLSLTLKQVERSYRNVRAERQIELGL